MPLKRPISCLLSLLSVLLLTSCKPTGSPNEPSRKDPPTLTLHQEDLVAVARRALSSGPLITGSIQAERVADVRAEVSATVLEVRKNNGERVRRGDMLVRFDDTAIKDALASAREAVRAGAQGLEQAQRQLKRLETLQASGMVTTQQLEDAQVRRNTLRSELSASESREAQAAQQLSRTTAGAPFDGVVAERKASPGDTAMVGKELLKVVDTASLRFEGLVAAEAATSLKPGQAVTFRVNGYGQQAFAGVVRRIYPIASTTTRQVAVLVSIDQGPQPSLIGLYAEGRVASQARQVLAIAPSAVIRQGDKAFAWCVQSDSLHKAELTLGQLDQDQGAQEVLTGLSEGQSCLRFPSTFLTEGQKVVLPKPRTEPPKPAS